MNRIMMTISLILLAAWQNSFAIDLEYIRSNYSKAVEDKTLCKRLIEQLSNKAADPTYLAYLGAFQAIWANHTINPLSQLNTFNTGKGNIEKAIRQEPENVELRFIRFSIQKQCPAFLGYKDNLSEDRNFIRNHIQKVNSGALLQMINNILE